DFVSEMYGDLPLNQSQSRENIKFTKLLEIDDSMVNQTIRVRGRVQNKRIVSGKKIFLILRQQNSTAQCVVSYYNPNDENAKSDNKIPASLHMIRYIQNIPTESLIDIIGFVVKPANKVKSCTVSDYELQIKGAYTVSKTTKAKLPYTFESATRPDEKRGNKEQAVRVTLDTCLNNRVYDLRTITNHAIFKIQAAVCRIFRNFLDSKGFTEIHTPKLIGAASEGGASVFEVKYFNSNAYLAQSPQFYKQMMISSDFERVYEIGPVFRAENSNTHRHLTEFTGLDLEMAFNEHYHEVLDLFDELFVTLFTELKEKYAYEISIVQKQFPVPDFEFLPKSLRLKFKDAVKLMKDEEAESMGDFDDLSTKNERFLGKAVKRNYKTDFYMLDKFPKDVRPFYTMEDPEKDGYSNSYDFFMRGEEIMSGAQRIHDPEMLKKSAIEHGVDPATIQGYLDAFEYGVSPHAGGGIGLERIVMLYFGLGQVKRASLFPRDPSRLSP
ncbi:aspartyl-tRNA synthetase, partial [Neocallimastix californiae]